ncbi:MAG TPA: hypothetical protein VH063_19165 [Gaiellaceae bacterium]|jgi:glycine cleavage system regulatory protein|nr:hypothetical protein [Gaiellaceae bacterium]
METTLEAAPETGAPVFAMELALGVPGETSIQDLRDELDHVCDSLDIDLQLEAL